MIIPSRLKHLKEIAYDLTFEEFEVVINHWTRCSECGSLATYVSPNGYDTVRVCTECGSEEHIPAPTPKRNPNDRPR